MITQRLRQFSPIWIILGFALTLRLWRLNQPKGYIFDEIYYAKNAASLIDHGVELDAAGQADFIVHPPLGKWIIGIGIKLFGNNEFGWRIMAALIGSASVLLIFLIAQKLFQSLFLSNTAALLMSFDGLHLVMSRVALLDIFLMFFILLTFYLILLNNYLLASVVLGLAGATKWSGFFLIPLLIGLMIFTHLKKPLIWIKQISLLIIIPFGIYLISWAGWLANTSGWSRDSRSNPFASLINYHVEIFNFHKDLTEAHAYAANPWSWLILGRPTSFYYESPSNCGAANCAQEILAIGTPILWWVGIFAIALTAGLFITNKDRKAGLILLFIAATYLPWFVIQSRTMFYFYAISILPFLILALIYAFNWAMTYRNFRKEITLFVILVGINFFYFLPIFIGLEIPYSHWLHRMWLPSWI